MNDFLTALLLGIIEGITEFLPISSTGHLIVANQWLSFNNKSFEAMFDVVIQTGAILSVIVYFRNRLIPRAAFGSPETNKIMNLWMKSIAGVIPALFFGALLDDVIEQYLFNPTTVAIALAVGGIILLIIENRKQTAAIDSVDMITYKTAIAIGLIQCLAMIPGTSRSAATIIGAMLLGCSRVAAAEFSFFLAIPTIGAASAYKLMKSFSTLDASQGISLGIGFIISFITALLVIALFMSFISKRDFKIFGYYRIALGAIILMFFI